MSTRLVVGDTGGHSRPDRVFADAGLYVDGGLGPKRLPLRDAALILRGMQAVVFQSARGEG